MADILNETEEQKQAGRIKYLVVAEEKDICTQQRTRRDDVGTRRGGGDVNPSCDLNPSHNPSHGTNTSPGPNLGYNVRGAISSEACSSSYNQVKLGS